MALRFAAGLTALLLPGAIAVAQPAASGQPATAPNHRLEIRLDPAGHRLTASDEVTWPDGSAPGARTFVLNAALTVTRAEPPLTEVPAAAALRELGLPASQAVAVKAYRASAPGGVKTLSLSYEGVIHTPLSDPREEYTRGFRDTSGLIGPEGVYLAGASVWHARFGPELVTFDLTVSAPESWHVISQGNGTSRGADGRARWNSGGPMDEIYVVGGPLHQFKDSAGAIETLVYLHERDASLAGKYLAATAQYIEMYRTLIGPYPYGKFALVENFWETGYGMPTFTLLGPQVIRFPFIINSSYPHEILHNWWGNSVFVDYATGNWCEGLTAYLADHLIQEQRGAASDYRRATLQKYRDYVRSGRDFPLAEFRERFSAATEAVGYGKALMGYHALRLHIGDDAFRATFARFYREFKGRRASFRDIQRVAEAVSGKPLAWIFDDLVTRAGAPVIEVSTRPADVRREGERYTVHGVLRQSQPGAPFTADVPLLVQTERGVTTAVVRLDRAERPFAITSDSRPVALSVDPNFDVFRRLDPRETPPSIGQIFGEPSILAVLPADAGEASLAAYRELLKGWQSDAHRITVVLDRDLPSLPADRAAWVIGRTNRLAPALFGKRAGLRVDASGIGIDGEQMPLAGHTLVATFRHPENVEKAIGWIVADPTAALPGLGRKLPHYGKYSYLGFQGDEPANIIKGQWQQSDSPLRVDLRPDGTRGGRLEPPPADARKALAELPPVFSQQALREHITYLASPELQGRGLGSEGLAKAAQYVADRFKAYGLLPGGDGGTYFQRVTVPRGPGGGPVEAANVVALLPGANDAMKDQSAVLGAHVDHLGTGWPDVHAGDEGKAHPGADDNASGVAVMLELARVLAAGERPPRTVVFIAFTGEEAGRLGSKHYVANPARPIAGVEGMINLDTVGRLGTQKITALGTGTATEWQHIFRGASFVTGIESRSVPESLESSDQVSFTERNVPAVQIFTAAHADYHRPSDTADKIDIPGLAKVAAFVKEGITYLAERPEPLTNTIKPGPASGQAGPASPKPPAPAAAPSAQAPASASQARRASLGTVPDFAFPGPGVRVSGVVPDSPAAKAGIAEGDIIVRLGDSPVANLQEYSNVLRLMAPGQRVAVGIRRDAQDVVIEVTLGER